MGNMIAGERLTVVIRGGPDGSEAERVPARHSFGGVCVGRFAKIPALPSPILCALGGALALALAARPPPAAAVDRAGVRTTIAPSPARVAAFRARAAAVTTTVRSARACFRLPRACGCCDDYCPKPAPCVRWPCAWPEFFKCPPPVPCGR